MSGSKIKPDFPPLLADGFHAMTLKQVRALCVTPFKSSVTRRAIMDGLLKVINKLNAADIHGSLWLDGSFLTQVIDPSDVDYVLCVGSDVYDKDARKRVVIDWASSAGLKDSLSCDAYKWVEYKRGHPRFCDSEDERKWWTGWYGLSLSKKYRKGIAVVSLPAAVK